MNREKKRISIGLKLNYRGDIMTNFTDIKRIIREDYEQLYVNKLNNLDEIDKFLEAHNLPGLNTQEI